ncbi:flagellar export protein FliJ [Photobacterium angustum]|uniref:Flagellar FliJ protein n=1 Tax=Photobacterium angustum TaxID=661 RepID=A0A855SJF2_PHOAN|nr:flagellar export protein FliJ [Photobacterium angustum]KJF82860.1 flagellar biogenesis protein [Photobacterium damselae subsp. damselae]KJG42212.1 flagellar biogenesis protein [Photobacterium angustum]KJG46998.1 flagellar biogenesis protein [Photobacterium angustum]KJG50964.1 flagellar biogenesis protein [Photobacterium angustum]KJG54817.1 flagellar biogenesis protein [Photobacterium angustum]
MSNALGLIIEQAKEQEHQASLALNQARIEQQNYLQQLAQIEKYRLDYLNQLSVRGQQGLTASEYSHLQKFLTQLDQTLEKQKQAGGYFEEQIQKCSQHWQEMQQKRRSVEWLVEKREREHKQWLDKQDQKKMDEYVTLQFARRLQQ